MNSGEISAPPSIPFALSIGVTGHRLDAFAPDALAGIAQRIGEVLDLLVIEARALALREAALFADRPPAITLVSPLADGADQIAAELALERGLRLQAVLPFERDTYKADFDARGAEQLDQALARAGCVLELPGLRNNSASAYVQAGRATVAHSDLLIAVWDGLPARGRGGTAEIIELALARGTPIIHVQADPATAPVIMWSAFDPAIVTQYHGAATCRAFDATQVRRLLTLLLAPPENEREREDLRYFLKERDFRVRPRIEYPLLLAMAGTRRFRRGDWQDASTATATRDEWMRYRQACAGCHGVSAELDLLEQAYGWSDRLASHFAQTYRSGHVFNFLSAAIAVLIALAGLFLPSAKIALATAEFLVILAIMLNTHIGIRKRWHQRWLDYRQLAERLRPMRSLKLLGIAAPDAPGSATEPVARRWTDWYAAGVWRTMGCPSGQLDQSRAAALARAIGEHELAPQIAYNRSSAEQVERLDQRLETLGGALFAATLLGCVVLIAGLILAPGWTAEHSKVFVLLSAGLPALGTAIFGIRVQGDFAGTALRSQATADLLERIADDLGKAGPDLARSADLTEQAARVMLADLGQWRLVNQQHELAVG
ncbi:MAG TPA: hypothetical protein VNI79_07585 [Sphingomicrobium sp.]|nr:hypothetical protein [Sphingomicrobium sp.]